VGAPSPRYPFNFRAGRYDLLFNASPIPPSTQEFPLGFFLSGKRRRFPLCRGLDQPASRNGGCATLGASISSFWAHVRKLLLNLPVAQSPNFGSFLQDLFRLAHMNSFALLFFFKTHSYRLPALRQPLLLCIEFFPAGAFLLKDPPP